MMVNNIRGRPGQLQINVVEDAVLLHGQADESAGKLLQGSVTLDLAEPMKVRAVHLKFSGKMNVSWSEGIGHHQHYHKQERTLISHKWQYVPLTESPVKKTYTLAAGQHKWFFELPLPGHLPQSLEAEGGRVSYRLKAVVERPTFIHNIIKKRPIRIVRCILPSEFQLSQTLEIHNTWSDKMEYAITLPSKIYAHGETIPISFDIRPIATNLRVRSLSGTLKEYCTYTTSERSKTDTRVVRTERQDRPFASMALGQGLEWKRLVRVHVPDRSPFIFCDADNDMIRIRHKLKFVISLENADGHTSELRCSVPIIVIDTFVQRSEGNALPAYDETWRSVPYDRAVWDVLRTRTSSVSAEGSANALSSSSATASHGIGVASSSAAAVVQQERQPITIASRTRALSITSTTKAGLHDDHNSNSNSTAEENSGFGYQPRSVESSNGLWWHGMELSRVPSYQTAAQQEPAALSSSLPPYDSLSVSPRWTR
ncbi:hypothetical protein BDB00DRAFT_459522 [Zychaea mexicana]|uniref:uncharacterized protein n=1 Tax=Zychaea mexicana TaxID=64656 RepID=UPI0022FE95AF|nr:uncharacterized protein BDB00DRAFT_459522 [Zychaea mexicana]KAI9492050.1 hypothetical protein BDB00DRAFT_459522 [Zychaea mexicana]